MKSRALTCITTMILFGALVILVRLVAQKPQTESATTVIANPVPLINQPLVPDAIKPGGVGFTITVNGTGFVSNSVVKWNGSPRATKFVSRSQLKATILSSDIAKGGTSFVTVSSPGPGGGTSNPDLFTVTHPTASISLNIAAYRTGSGSQSVAVADFNRDRKLDLAVANLYSNTVSVLLGNGDGTFQKKVDYATGLNPASVTVGDFNGDGKLDLAVATAGGPSVGVLLGNGDGTFQAHVDYPTGFAPDAVAVGDFNGDGKLDVVTANNTGNGNGTVSVLLGNGDGTFQPHVDYATGSGPAAVAVGDFNKDGHLDLVVANGSGSVSILLGNGDGTFKSRVDYPIPPFTFAVAVGDFNGDSKLDLAVASFVGGNNLSILLGNGDGTFQALVEYAAGGDPYGVAVGDFNGDGKLDLAIVNGKASVLFGNGNGTFQTHVDFPAGSDPLSLAVGDFNGDGQLDLAVANNSASGNGAVSILLQSPTVSVSKTALTFSNQVIDTSSTTQTITLTNSGYLSLKISSISITGTNAGDFSQSHTCGSSLSVGGSCTISIIFRPTTIGPRSASLTIGDNGVGSPQSIALRGTGVVSGPNATLSPTSLSFIPEVVGTTSAARSVKLTDYGTSALSIAIRTTGDFSQTNTCGSTLAAGASCHISVFFKATQPGTRTGTLSIADNAPGSPQMVALSGIGALSTAVTLAPTSLSFGCAFTCYRQPCGCHCSPPQTVSLTDAGSATLYINDITTSGPFSQTHTCGTSLGAKQSCSITVSAVPRGKGTFTGALAVDDTGTASSQKVNLTEDSTCP